MRYLLLFFVLVSILLWAERFYYKRRAEILEMKLLGRGLPDDDRSVLNAWLDGRIEAKLARERRKAERSNPY